jgi:vitamin B12/bleomycin/antimicrobial peptide transport system ATP-binding/permease protein
MFPCSVRGPDRSSLGAPFASAMPGETASNPDQRIHEDARHLTELSADLGIGLLQSSLLMLSGNVTFHLSGRSFAIPGYMVWCALVYAGTASRLSWRVGPPDYAPAPFH